jgi:hypothetical protein
MHIRSVEDNQLQHHVHVGHDADQQQVSLRHHRNRAFRV